jgi:pimeloyl-ACP methyl ester carboxylesterase
VIVVPGFCSPDISTANLRRFLVRQGFSARSWDCGLNLGPASDTVEKLERKVRESAERHARKVALVGVSLGGTLARETAKRCPDCVERVVTLVSPINLPVATPLAPLAWFVSVFWDKDAIDAIGTVRQAPAVPVTAIVSPDDGVIDWRACIPEPSPHVELVMIAGGHMTMGSNPHSQRVVAARLATARDVATN